MGEHKDKRSDELMINVRGFKVRMRNNSLSTCFFFNDAQVESNERTNKKDNIE